MALRGIFSQDDDFKESMFARQIAVMKGQAWNVVETLKQPDHGPLELTRRARVCVWDDLVDVPVAIPLRAPSTEMQRRKFREYDDADDAEEEMDIGAALSPEHDLLGLGSPSGELPNPNRFELSRDRSSTDLGRASTGVGSEHHGYARPGLGDMSHMDRSWATLPPRPVPSTGGGGGRRSSHQKYGSLSSGRRSTFTFNGDDLEGDLGYAAAEGMEGHQRKVIVERLETVKAKNPVFTWC